MDISEIGIPTITRMELTHPEADKPSGIFITGHTPDSKVWRQAQRDFGPKKDGMSMQISKSGESTVPLKSDPDAYENRIKRLAAVVTNIEGLKNGSKNWEFSPENVLTLFSRDDCAWIVDAWEDWMEDRSNFLPGAA